MAVFVRLFALVLIASVTMRTAMSQEMRLFTVVYDLSKEAEGQRPPVVARAVTFFHAGKVYDYVDAADEVLVFEPTQRQFRVLSPSRGIVASVAFDEINQLVKIARDETDKQAEKLAVAPSGDAQNGALLRFQLAPRFEETFDPQSGRLLLDGDVLSYEVQTAEPGRPGIANAYLDYADWACRLNYLLHPGPLLPKPRLSLNDALRSRNRLPTTVTLKAMAAGALHLRAEHSTSLDLNSRDRDMIYQWESQLKSEATREVTLREYQRTVVTARAR